MSTTYTKIKAVLLEISGDKLTANDLRDRMIKRDIVRSDRIFHLKGRDGRTKAISSDTFNVFFLEMIDLNLLDRDSDERLSAQKAAKNVISEEKKFQSLLSRKIAELFAREGFTLSDVRAAADSIQYPHIRDADTILDALKSKKNTGSITRQKFKRLLFLLSNAEQNASRSMRVFYNFK